MLEDSNNTDADGEETLLDFMESYMGEVTGSWGNDAEGSSPLIVPVVQFANPPHAGWQVVSTLGLSQRVLVQPSGAELRQELLVCWPEEALHAEVPAHMHAIAQALIESGEALGHGDVIPIPADGPQPPSGSEMTWGGWFVTIPYFLPESALLYEKIDPPVLLAWILPVYAVEMKYIEENGSDAFIDKMLKNRDAVFSWPRPSLV